MLHESTKITKNEVEKFIKNLLFLSMKPDIPKILIINSNQLCIL